MKNDSHKKDEGCGSCSSSENCFADMALKKKGSRRGALTALFGGAATAAASSAIAAASTEDEKELKRIKRDEIFQKYYRTMTEEERAKTIKRFERKSKVQYGVDAKIDGTSARPNTLFGYAFNISKCEGSRKCVDACVTENNQDRTSGMQYIKLFEMEGGMGSVHEGDTEYSHEVPVEGKYYMGTQCFHCENPPCTKACPTGATWTEPDGIVVVDYNWCIGCRYCEAACPYFARRFNWKEPEVPSDEINPYQHYLGNRMRSKGVMEKCTFCIQRTRQGKQPACAEACPTGARVFGNLLDPDSEIRWILENKKVFRLKEDLGTEPKFWYFTD
jgi:Fe-S-cluster-containing dehydrogenase component